MDRPRIVLTGFGPFPGVAANPSGEVVRALVSDPPANLEIKGGELPVTFAGVSRAYDALLAGLSTRPVVGLVALGVHPGASFRLERLARCKLSSPKPDNEGVVAAGVELDGEDLETRLDLESLADRLTGAGAPEVEISQDAGGYVCERTYHHVLTRARERGVPGLFLHVPPAERVPVERQTTILRHWLPSLLAQDVAATSGVL